MFFKKTNLPYQAQVSYRHFQQCAETILRMENLDDRHPVVLAILEHVPGRRVQPVSVSLGAALRSLIRVTGNALKGRSPGAAEDVAKALDAVLAHFAETTERAEQLRQRAIEVMRHVPAEEKAIQIGGESTATYARRVAGAHYEELAALGKELSPRFVECTVANAATGHFSQEWLESNAPWALAPVHEA